jgi:hypothetical protein
MSPRILLFSAVPAIYIVASTTLLFTRNARALRALERFAPAGSGSGWRGWGRADVELGGMRCEIRWGSWRFGRMAVNRWMRFCFQTATTGELTVTPREFRLAARLREVASGPSLDLGDEALQAKFTVYGSSAAFARRVLTPEVRGILLGLERLGPLLAVSAGAVQLDLEANPIMPGAPLPPDQLVRCLEEGHRLALAVTRAGSEGKADDEAARAGSEAKADDEAARAGSEARADDEAARAGAPHPEHREPHARPKETGRILMLATLLALLGLVVVTSVAPGIFAGSGPHYMSAPPDPAPAKHR